MSKPYISKRTPEQRAQHAEYMRRYYAEHPGYKANADAKHRKKYLDRLLSYDRYRNAQPERKAQRQEAARRRRLEKGEELREYAKTYYQKHKTKWVENRNKRRDVIRTRQPWYTMKCKYGITRPEYEEMLRKQDGRCAICNQPPRVGFNKKLHIDHDHKTGKVRGLLCMHCNHSLERLENVSDWTEQAMMYLARSRT